MRTSFACDLETMARLAEYETDYRERYFLPVDSARKGASWKTDALSIKINDEAMRGHLDRDLANTAVAALTALSKSINK